MIFIGSFYKRSIPKFQLKSTLENYNFINWQASVIINNNFLDIIAVKCKDNKDDYLNIILEQNIFICGNLFTKNTYSDVFSKNSINEINNLSPEETIRNYWGNYIIIKIIEESKEIQILRDPTGLIPFFYFETNEYILFSNEISIISKVIDKSFTLDIRYLKYFLTNGSVTSELTPFYEVKELPYGCNLILTQNHPATTKVCWNPYEFFINNKEMNFNDTISDISIILQSVVTCQINLLKNIFIDFSGGLDSTGILYCIAKVIDKKEKIKAINLFHPLVNSSNESEHARKIARELKIELIECDDSQSLPYSPHEKLTLLPNKPDDSLIRIKLEQNMNKISKGYKSFRFFSGEGGDHLFMCPPAIESICDLLIDKHYNKFSERAKELGMIMRIPLINILKTTIKSGC